MLNENEVTRHARTPMFCGVGLWFCTFCTTDVLDRFFSLRNKWLRQRKKSVIYRTKDKNACTGTVHLYVHVCMRGVDRNEDSTE